MNMKKIAILRDIVFLPNPEPRTTDVIPANAGTQGAWTPVFAGVTIPIRTPNPEPRIPNMAFGHSEAEASGQRVAGLRIRV
jgi:hypothetical protein